MKQNNLGNYTLEPIKFVFCDTGGFSDPFILKLSQDDLERSMRGFKIRGYRYKGVERLLEELQHHLSTGNWTSSYEEYKNKSVISLNLQYGSR
jgi:hypothetical protein